jgi:hypothetical protein
MNASGFTPTEAHEKARANGLFANATSSLQHRGLPNGKTAIWNIKTKPGSEVVDWPTAEPSKAASGKSRPHGLEFRNSS